MLNVVALQVKVDNEESDESYDSSWSYMQHMQSNALVGHDRRTFHKELTEFQVTIRPPRPPFHFLTVSVGQTRLEVILSSRPAG